METHGNPIIRAGHGTWTFEAFLSAGHRLLMNRSIDYNPRRLDQLRVPAMNSTQFHLWNPMLKFRRARRAFGMGRASQNDCVSLVLTPDRAFSMKV